MTQSNSPDHLPEGALLPEGLHDDLPPEAGAEARVVTQLVQTFEQFGYGRVKPPLVEFEEGLLAGPGAELSRDMFRLMDPISQRMMALRADMTTQVARIATTRLQSAPRPLRLCYSGQVLRVRGSQLRPERQFAQAGIELIGATGAGAVVEAILLSVEALEAVGLKQLSVDITMPRFVPALAESLGLNKDETTLVCEALEHKDTAQLELLQLPERALFNDLLLAAGPAAEALTALGRATFPESAGAIIDELRDVLAQIRQAMPALLLTVDPGESSGFSYQTGLSFTLFAKGVRGELGRGGQYRLASGEPATGATLYLDSVMRGVADDDRPTCVYLPAATSFREGRALRDQGWRTVAALARTGDPQNEARSLGCTHILIDGKPQSL